MSVRKMTESMADIFRTYGYSHLQMIDGASCLMIEKAVRRTHAWVDRSINQSSPLGYASERVVRM